MPRSPRILIVDDFPNTAELLGRGLSRFGYEVRTATDGVEAIPIARDFRPDFVLLDLGMPKLNGFETAQRIRNEDWGRGMILIALSAHWGREYQRRAQKAGFDKYLCKPVPAKRISAVIENISNVDSDGQAAFNFTNPTTIS